MGISKLDAAGRVLAVGTVLGVVAMGWADEAATPDLPLNRYQFIGTHNSYHLAPDAKLRAFIERMMPGQGEALNYSHRPLREQLEQLGVRQIELDVYGDPQGGLYANPLGPRVVGTTARTDPAWLEPGFKVFHSPDFDTGTTVITLRRALRELRDWSKSHPAHEPVLVLLELEEESFSAVKPPVFDGAALLALEAEIHEVLPDGELLTPDAVRDDAPTLREAITQHGWPALSQTRGKFIFALDNENHVREDYLALSSHPDLRGRLCFVSVPPEHPAAAWMKRNDPVGSFAEIRSLVRAGFMVRTRADADMKEVRANETSRRDAAMASGAQWISTDAPEANPNSGYAVAWPGRAVMRVAPEN